jgi:hypothetical protein
MERAADVEQKRLIVINGGDTGAASHPEKG